jgi:hypothetical protein
MSADAEAAARPDEEEAMDDLMHFVVLLTIVFTIYTVMGYIVFGPTIASFSTIGLASKTVFNMLIGEFADTEDELLSQDVDSGPLLIPAVLFFYSFMFIVNLVILNFFLAIVVDAYSDVKGDHAGTAPTLT